VEPLDESQIIRSVLEGDSEAYAELVRLYHGRVFSLCLSILLNRSEAEDAAQEAFVKAFASLSHYKRTASFSAWIYRITSNHCLDQLRKRKRQKTDSLDGLVEQKGDSFEPLESVFSDPSAGDSEKQEKLEFALRALATLSPDHRQALILREVEGLTYEEIGTVLQCSLDAVKSRLRRARLQLQEKTRHFMRPHSFNKRGPHES
jgi:RNA polymerase sigma-70 factor (ECF subfamily)